MYVVSLSSEFPNDNPALHRGVIWVCLEPTGRARPERPAGSLLDAEVKARTQESVPPAADAEVDDAGPILVEELEPLEAVSVEGPTTIVDEGVIEIEPAPPEVIAAEAEVTAAAPEVMAAEAAPEVMAAEAPEVMAVEAAPEPVVELPAPVSEVVLVGTSERADEGAVTPAFEELPASDFAPQDSTELPPASDDPFTILVCALADVAIGAGSAHVASLLPGLMFDGRLPEPLDGDAEVLLRSAGLLEGGEVSPAFVSVMGAWREILRGTSDDFAACGASMLDEWASELLAKLLAAPAKAPILRQELRNRGVAAFGLAA